MSDILGLIIVAVVICGIFYFAGKRSEAQKGKGGNGSGSGGQLK